MGNLSKDDYRKIKNIIETFIDTPVIIDNLFKSLILFLETKKEESIMIVKEESLTPVSSSTALRVKNEIENADIAMEKFTNRIRKANVKGKRKANSKVVS
jgi:hypothetical protein